MTPRTTRDRQIPEMHYTLDTGTEIRHRLHPSRQKVLRTTAGTDINLHLMTVPGAAK